MPGHSMFLRELVHRRSPPTAPGSARSLWPLVLVMFGLAACGDPGQRYAPDPGYRIEGPWTFSATISDIPQGPNTCTISGLTIAFVMVPKREFGAWPVTGETTGGRIDCVWNGRTSATTLSPLGMAGGLGIAGFGFTIDPIPTPVGQASAEASWATPIDGPPPPLDRYDGSLTVTVASGTTSLFGRFSLEPGSRE